MLADSPRPSGKAIPSSCAYDIGVQATIISVVELAPQNIPVAHFVIDGGIRKLDDGDDGGDTMLHPDAIARSYLDVHRQHRSAWTWEMELRPWVETF